MDAGARQNIFYCSAHPNIAKSEHKWIQRTVSVLRKIDKNPTRPLSTESKSQGKQNKNTKAPIACRSHITMSHR